MELRSPRSTKEVEFVYLYLEKILRRSIDFFKGLLTSIWHGLHVGGRRWRTDQGVIRRAGVQLTMRKLGFDNSADIPDCTGSVGR